MATVVAADFQAEGELYKTALYDLHQELGGKVRAEPKLSSFALQLVCRGR